MNVSTNAYERQDDEATGYELVSELDGQPIHTASYRQIPDEVWENPAHSDRAVRLYLAVLKYPSVHDERQGFCFAAQNTLMADIHLAPTSYRYFRAARDELIATDSLGRIRRGQGLSDLLYPRLVVGAGRVVARRVPNSKVGRRPTNLRDLAYRHRDFVAE